MRVGFKSEDSFNMDLYFDSSTALEEHVNKGYKLVSCELSACVFHYKIKWFFLTLKYP